MFFVFFVFFVCLYITIFVLTASTCLQKTTVGSVESLLVLDFSASPTHKVSFAPFPEYFCCHANPRLSVGVARIGKLCYFRITRRSAECITTVVSLRLILPSAQFLASVEYSVSQWKKCIACHNLICIMKQSNCSCEKPNNPKLVKYERRCLFGRRFKEIF